MFFRFLKAFSFKVGWKTVNSQPLQGSAPVGVVPRETRRLSDVRGYAQTHGSMIAGDAEVSGLMQTFEPISEVDEHWKNSPCYPVPYITELKRITVIPGCRLLLNDQGSALSDEIDLGYRNFGLRPKFWDMEITEGHNITFNFYPLSPEAISSGIHMTGEHEGNYFHWIVEILPRLFLCEQLLKGKHIPILISEGLHANLIALLDIIRAPERPVLQLQKNRTYFVENLIYPSDVARLFDTYDRAPGDDTIYIPVALLKGMAAKIKRSLVDIDNFDNHKKRLFVRRNSSYRMLLNQSAIESMLAERGFHVIDPETMTIEEQICNFSKAEVVIGPSGAGMANILWCKPETRILILHSDHPYKKYPYWDALARASGSKIAYLAGVRAFNVTDIFEAHDDFSISPSDLDKLLDVEGARI